MDEKKPRFAVVAPVFAVADIKKSIAYYAERLGFRTGFEWSDAEDDPVRYAIMIKDDTELHLTQSDVPRKSIAYFFLSGVEEYYCIVKNGDAIITQDIADYPWEMREFEVEDPDGNRLIFGEHLDRLKGA